MSTATLTATRPLTVTLTEEERDRLLDLAFYSLAHHGHSAEDEALIEAAIEALHLAHH